MLAALLVAGPGLVDMAFGYARQAGTCRVTAVVDGDTVKMICPEEGRVRGRIVGLDAPEVKGECMAERWAAWRATQALRWRLWTARRVGAEPGGVDRYGRVLVRLTLDGRDAAQGMIDSGHARAYGGGKRQGWCGGTA
ncbi:thermonuclease family protein [Vannielia litorea]|uniref:thermonuclease family protein n=1 Tax=Vannielia litorea TaxID=1217970 RepID=UPI001C9590B8|nr:thermonuclease family protein [Vannielia litorea]MBY6046923.1 thermonuclease family protein [Vannielia litorea]MBY6074337.1 thermonuclease family protein [Vannielia litorea]